MPDRLVRAIWYGSGAGSTLTRAMLAPVAWIYGALGAVVMGRRARRAGRSAVPTVSIGNLTVGGTGKTPIAAWFAAALRERGLRPALLLRGYGDDEPAVHALLNPDVPVFAHPDRRASGARAVAQGAAALVLDDAFQHRQMPRDLDVVLVSADAWNDHTRLLPAGPFREGLAALQRAQLVVVTRKATDDSQTARVVAAVQGAVRQVPVAVARLVPSGVVAWGTARPEPLNRLAGARVLGVCGIGEPAAFLAQLRATGADVTPVTFGDHHAFTEADARRLAARARGMDRVVCTLKDAVKLGPCWPAGAPELWYLSQAVTWEANGPAVEALLDRLKPLAAHPTPATAGPMTDDNG